MAPVYPRVRRLRRGRFSGSFGLDILSLPVIDPRLDQLARYRRALGINMLVWALQLAVIAATGNGVLTLFGDNTHGFSDIIVLLGTIFVYAKSIREPEKDHGRLKYAVAVIAVILLWAGAGVTAIEAFERIREPVDFPSYLILGLAATSATGNWYAHRIVSGAAVETHDHTHRANVAHLFTDFALSFLVFVSALGNLALGWPAIDAWLAIVLVVPWMVIWGWLIIRRKDHTGHDHDHHHH